jgi:hypothetical protein
MAAAVAVSLVAPLPLVRPARVFRYRPTTQPIKQQQSEAPLERARGGIGPSIQNASREGKGSAPRYPDKSAEPFQDGACNVGKLEN